MAKKYSKENKNTIQASADTRSSRLRPGITDVINSVALPGWMVIPAAAIFILLLALAGSMDNSVEKWVGLLSAVMILVLTIVIKPSAMKRYATPLFFSIAAYVIWGGVSTLYAASGKFALYEFSKLLFAFCVYIAVLYFTTADEGGFKRISLILAVSGGFYGILSIDAASSGIVANAFKLFMGLFTDIYATRGVFEEGIRITGIFGNPNIYAGFMAIALFFSLYLTMNASGKKDTYISTSLLAINALSYLLAFSLGSIFMFVIACLIMIGISERGKKLNLFILMAETAVLALLFAMLSMAGLGKSGAASFVPLVAVILNAILLCFIDNKLRASLNKRLSVSRKLAFRIVIFVIIILVGYAAAAFTVSGDLNLSSNETVMRALYIPGGDYTLVAESSSVLNLTVDSQNEEDLIKHTSTQIFIGTNQQEMHFTVPEDSKIVRIYFTSENEEKTAIGSCHYRGASEGKVHLNYPLLPNIIANRLQNIFANENMVQRGIFFEDGMKLFSKSPIIGRGLGGFENGIYGVQDFYYETKYAHNHYIQALSDTGIVGFVIFLSLLGISVISIVNSKRRNQSLFAVPVLAACVFLSFGQAMSDATWSAGVFLGFAFAMLALLTIFCTDPIRLQNSAKEKFLLASGKAGLVLFAAIFTLLITGNLYAQAHAQSGVKSFKDIERLISLDRFEYNDYKVSYIVNAPKSEDNAVLSKADVYAQELNKVESNSIAPYVMRYNFSTYKDADAFTAAKQGIQNAQSSPLMWSRIFDICEEYIDPVGPYTDDAAERLRSSKFYIDSVLELYETLLDRNSSSLDQITLSPYNNTFIGKMLEIRAVQGYDVESALIAIMSHAFDSDYAADANQDGIPDSISVLSGSMVRNEAGLFVVSDNTVLELNLYQKLRGNYVFTVRTETPQEIKISMDGNELQPLYDTNKVSVSVELQDNTEMKLSKFTVTIPRGAIIDYMDFKTDLE